MRNPVALALSLTLLTLGACKKEDAAPSDGRPTIKVSVDALS